MEFTTTAQVITVSSEIREKSNGNTFQKCVVEHLDGKLKGKRFFANRTLGEDKPEVSVNDKVTCYNRVEDGQLYSEISLSAPVDNLEDILSSIGSTASTTVNAEQHI